MLKAMRKRKVEVEAEPVEKWEDRRKWRFDMNSTTRGLWLGLIAVGIVVTVVLIVRGQMESSSRDPCDQSLPSLGESVLSIAQFQNVEGSMALVAQAAEQGDVPAAERLFFGPVHTFTHYIDPPLRQEDPDLAKEFCRSVIEIETEFDLTRRPENLAQQAEEIRRLLQEARNVLFPLE